MNEQAQPVSENRRRGNLLSAAAAVLVVLLALGALLWPQARQQSHAHTLLVFDTSGDQARVTHVFGPLREYLANLGEGDLALVVVRTVGEFRTQLAVEPDFILAPDGLALTAAAGQYLPLVVGRRAAPRNLRPRGVLVYRRSAGDQVEPWLTHAGVTVFGDSLSLTAVGVLRAGGETDWRRECASGPDPYDHGPVLHALRLGGFDYAIVRQWDADRFFAEGLLPRRQFGVRDLIAPVPDAVLMVSRQVPRHVRLRCGEGLSALGRQQGDEAPRERELRLALAELHLVGFNLLLEPDFELVRKNFPGDWLLGLD